MERSHNDQFLFLFQCFQLYSIIVPSFTESSIMFTRCFQIHLLQNYFFCVKGISLSQSSVISQTCWDYCSLPGVYNDWYAFLFLFQVAVVNNAVFSTPYIYARMREYVPSTIQWPCANALPDSTHGPTVKRVHATVTV